LHGSGISSAISVVKLSVRGVAAVPGPRYSCTRQGKLSLPRYVSDLRAVEPCNHGECHTAEDEGRASPTEASWNYLRHLLVVTVGLYPERDMTPNRRSYKMWPACRYLQTLAPASSLGDRNPSSTGDYFHDARRRHGTVQAQEQGRRSLFPTFTRALNVPLQLKTKP
jgi:hypothetical protein